jgi:histidyl-tRNA synthetase
MTSLIQPRTLKGFRDYPPELMISREGMLETARRVYRSYGFAPLDTPALEYAEILLGKGGAESDKLIYRFRDHGDRDVALRFDLTVPFARFAAEHIGKLGTPFKRYHMGPVWRGENTSHGRYREFWQCDFDTIGTTSNAADCETALVIHDVFEALDRDFGFGGFEIRINNRLLLNGLLEKLGIGIKGQHVLRALDKLAKIGRPKVAKEMVSANSEKAEQLVALLRSPDWPEKLDNALLELDLPFLKEPLTESNKRSRFADYDLVNWQRLRDSLIGISLNQANRVLDLAETTGENTEILQRVESEFGGNPKTAEGVRRLRELLAVTKTAGVADVRVRIDLSIARGLDYYTGTIYETFLQAMPGIGSVCSGGRYDNLASLYTKQVLPGVGASLGLDRFLAALEEMGKLDKTATPAPVIVFCQAMECLGDYQRIAGCLREAGIGVEVYPEQKKLGQQFQYAERRGHKLALIARPDEIAKHLWNVKVLAAQEQQDGVPEAELIETVRKLL